MRASAVAAASIRPHVTVACQRPCDGGAAANQHTRTRTRAHRRGRAARAYLTTSTPHTHAHAHSDRVVLPCHSPSPPHSFAQSPLRAAERWARLGADPITGKGAHAAANVGDFKGLAAALSSSGLGGLGQALAAHSGRRSRSRLRRRDGRNKRCAAQETRMVRSCVLTS
jgi:hypothetical protein